MLKNNFKKVDNFFKNYQPFFYQNKIKIAAYLIVYCVAFFIKNYCPKTHAKINGATIVASLSTINFGV